MRKISQSKAVVLIIVSIVFMHNARSSEEAEAIPETISDATPEAVLESTEEYLLAQKSRLLLEAKINDLENISNAYAEELSEPYLALGKALQTLGEHDDAVIAFNQAFQLARINYGLNSQQQVPILKELLLSNQNQESWEEVDSNHHLIHHIIRQNTEISDDQWQDSIAQLARWKLKAIDENLFPKRRGFIALEVGVLYRNEINNVNEEEDYPNKNKHLATLFLGHAVAQSYIVRDVMAKSVNDFASLEPRYVSRQRCNTVEAPDGTRERLCTVYDVDNPDYLRGKFIAKKQAISFRLRSMRDSLKDAWAILEMDGMESESSTELYAEAKRLEQTYSQLVREDSRIRQFRTFGLF